MAIIAISRGSFSKGKEIAERVADRLGYRCISREVIIEASREFNIPEIMLHRAVHDAPSILEKLTSITFGRERYISYFETTLLKILQKDNVVYHGFAGHFYIKEIAHTLKVRIIADMEERVRALMARDRISGEQAYRKLMKESDELRKWSLHLYGIDTADPTLFDLVLLVKNLSVDDAIDGICHFAHMETFKTTAESQRAIDDLVLAAEVKAALINLVPQIKVIARDGIVVVSTSLPLGSSQIEKLKEVGANISGVLSLDVKSSPVR